MQKLGKLIKTDLREIWKNEEYDFSTWLAKEENLALLSEELGISIRLIEMEAGVGKYSLDILGEEEGTGRKIVIENQLENTNHDHLGKIITYAAGHDAKIVIWIFKDICEEHRNAIDWLNESTDDDTLFFAVKIEAWRINDSDPASKFQVICRPNEWAKVVKHSSGTGELGDTQLKKLEFWTKLKSFAQERKINLFRQTPSPHHWYDIAIGSSQAHIGLTVNTRDNVISCELYINDNKALFNYLKMQPDLEIRLGGDPLEWIEAKKACRIIQRRENSDLDNEALREVLFSWMINKATKFQQVFSPLVKSFKE
jgi:hypothetical protein